MQVFFSHLILILIVPIIFVFTTKLVQTESISSEKATSSNTNRATKTICATEVYLQSDQEVLNYFQRKKL